MIKEIIKSYSFVIPVKDEENTIALLFTTIREVMMSVELDDFEVIFIDDGSSDGSWCIMKQLALDYPLQVRAIRLRRNFGKSVALAAGFQEASGDIVFTMDADLQDDPHEIPKFIEKIDDGYDVVSGWKENRQDPFSKTLPSKFFNTVTSLITGIKLHDFNCGFKAYRREVKNSLKVYGEMHRYMPVLAHDIGFRIGEVSVKHHPRNYGSSKYGWERLVRGFLDLLSVMATTRYLQRPGHLFGGAGIISGFLGSSILFYMSILWFIGSRPIGSRPLFFLGILLVILSFQLISLGILAEIITRHSNVLPLDNLISDRCCTMVDYKSNNSKQTSKPSMPEP